MSIRARVSLVIIWFASLLAVAAATRAQTLMKPLSSPVVLSGSDIGFRVEGQVGSAPAGVLVVRVNGEWVVPTTSVGPRRLVSDR